MKRRHWILSALGVGGALVVGWGVLPARSRLGGAALLPQVAGEVALNGWIRIAPDNSVVLAMPRSEMGQGVHTALAMLVAEELDVALARVRLEQAGADAIYGNVAALAGGMLPIHPKRAEGDDRPMAIKTGQWLLGKLARELGINVTGGSSSVSDAWEPMRLAGATARASLLAAAAAQWQVDAAQLRVSDGVVNHASGRSARYGELALAAAGIDPGPVRLKERSEWSVIGQARPRSDIPAKTDGTAVFGLDVRQPGMWFAAVRQCPMLGGSAANIDAKTALAMPGVERLVPLPSLAGSTAGFAVVARTTWHAQQAAQALQVQWLQRADGALDSGRMAAELAAALDQHSGFTFFEQGDAAQAEATAARVVTASYTAPYLAHATMEPMNCTVQFKDGWLDVWVPTQVPGMARDLAAKVAGVAKDRVRLHVTLLGGGFGRRLEIDFVGQAVTVAMACAGRPVQLVWSREEDMTHDFYRPMQVARLAAALDAQGQVSSLRIESAGDAIMPRQIERTLPWLAGPVDLPDKTTAEGLFDLPYGVPHQHMSHVSTHTGVPIGSWRSVGHSHNAFFSESFIDELALQAKADPLAFRRALLRDAPRHLAVLELAAAKAQWGQPLAAGRARGLALHESFGTVVAEVAEVSLQDGRVRVHRVVCAIDCGTVVNPGTVAQQMEGAVLFGLSAALHGRIDIREGVVQQRNFPDYPMLKLADSPLVETWIVPSSRAPSGVGEPGVPPIAPAVANALFTLTGQRLRALPLKI